MKNYQEAVAYLESRYQGDSLERALTALDYANDNACNINPDPKAVPVWSCEELDAMAETE